MISSGIRVHTSIDMYRARRRDFSEQTFVALFTLLLFLFFIFFFSLSFRSSEDYLSSFTFAKWDISSTSFVAARLLLFADCKSLIPRFTARTPAYGENQNTRSIGIRASRAKKSRVKVCRVYMLYIYICICIGLQIFALEISEYSCTYTFTPRTESENPTLSNKIKSREP